MNASKVINWTTVIRETVKSEKGGLKHSVVELLRTKV